MRLDDGFLITPTGGGKASKTIALHAQIYKAAAAYGAEARCVIHTHSTHCVSLTLTLSLPYQHMLPMRYTDMARQV